MLNPVSSIYYNNSIIDLLKFEQKKSIIDRLFINVKSTI